MKIMNSTFELLAPTTVEGLQQECKLIETAARTCYKSEDKITEDSWKKMVKFLREKNHTAMFEHSRLSVKFITDRGVTHEFVRHRPVAYAQESTRYCNYSKEKFGKEIAIINSYSNESEEVQEFFRKAFLEAETKYFELLEQGVTPQIARNVLPTGLKTEIVVTTNFREWLHIFELRCGKGAHPHIKSLLTPLYQFLHESIPEVFTIENLI